MKNRIIAGAAALAFAAGGFALGRSTAPEPVECLAALGAADAAIAVLAVPDLDQAERGERYAEIGYPTHRDACKEAI